MATQPFSNSIEAAAKRIPIRHITPADLRASLADGWRDFMEMRGDIIFLAILYPLIGIIAAAATMGGAAPAPVPSHCRRCRLARARCSDRILRNGSAA